MASGWSHLEVAKNLLKDHDADAYMVFEDDIKFIVNKSIVFDYLKHVPPNTDYINFARDITFHPLNPVLDRNEYFYLVRKQYTNNASSYLLTKQGASKILSFTNGCVGPAFDTIVCTLCMQGDLDFQVQVDGTLLL